MALTLFFWIVAAFFGTAGRYVTREAFLTTADGESIARCTEAAPELVEKGSAEGGDWCTYSGDHFGPNLPSDVQSHTGDLIIDRDTLLKQYWETAVQPDFWLTVGLGGGAIATLFGFARATGTVRAGLAASISVVFLGLLLFPRFFTELIDSDLKADLVSAWQWVILFYFGSETAIQGWKVLHNEGAGVGGDLSAGQATDG